MVAESINWNVLLRIDPVAMILSISVSSNLQRAATLVGDTSISG